MYIIDLKEFRRANKMTQNDLAHYFGIKVQGYISQMESGVRPVPEKYISKILADNTVKSSMVKMIDEDSEVKMSREVFDKIAQLIDAVCSQQETIAGQQRTIEIYAKSHTQTTADRSEMANAG